ncbi:MAG: acetyltransferase, gnat family [Gammaproteobacteria bacterium]|jgi:RimJ/RimL family protein N-acetyltransferase|nr:acetyltransferase, gnat family [Gammaproteobacteria bacterium]
MLSINPMQQTDVRLVALSQDHVKDLEKIAEDPRIWQHNPQIAHPHQFASIWLKNAFKKQAEKDQFPLVIFKQNRMAGSTRYYEYDAKHRHISIGYTWYHPDYWGSGLNTLVKTMMLHYAFSELNCERVAFSIDSENRRSCKAVEKLGAVKEGILRHHLVRPDNTFRDTVCYSILKTEWITREHAL